MKKFLAIVAVLVAVAGLVACENLVSVETTAEVASIEVFADPEVILAEKVESLKAVVAAYAWPEYHSDCLNQTVAYNAAYADAATEFVSNTGKQGNDCGVFVLIAMRNSGWDESYRTNGRTDSINTCPTRRMGGPTLQTPSRVTTTLSRATSLSLAAKGMYCSSWVRLMDFSRSWCLLLTAREHQWPTEAMT